MTRFIRPLYDWTLSLAAHKHAMWALFLISFAESSFFPIPPDVLLMAMVIATPHKAWRIAAVCTIGSVLGAIGGWMIGAYLAPVGHWLFEVYGHETALQDIQALYDKYGAWCVAIGALTPIPYKLVTVASGFFQYDLVVFTIASILARGARFFLVAALLWKFGPPIRSFVEKRLGLVFTLALACLIGGFILIGYVV